MTGEQEPADAAARAAVSCVIDERLSGDIAIVAVNGTVDSLTAPQLESALARARTNSPRAIIVDLSAVEFLASVGMGLLVATQGELNPGIGFAVVADGPATSRPMKLIGITEIVTVAATLDAAVAAVSA
jgi:anti-sigma B factor antagonist